MSSELAPAALIVTCVCGFIQVFCLTGFFALRHRTVFAIRIPEVILSGLILKLVSFSFVAWLFLSPTCPCAVATCVWWLDAVANHFTTFRKYVLVFRCEIQAALDKAKQEGVATINDNNLYVRYRYILKTRWQFVLMGVMLLYLALANAIVLAVFHEDASKPCLTVNLTDNKAYFWTIIVSFIYCFPLAAAGIWTTLRLKKFPKDNWKIDVESTIVSRVSGAIGTVFIILVAAVPGNDKTMFWHLVSGIYLSMLNFVLPLRLWQKSVKEIAQQELRKLASLRRLLKEPEFFHAFDVFLKSEFSYENLYFWNETEKLLRKYQAMLPADIPFDRSETPSTSPRTSFMETDQSVYLAAASDFLELARQCIGEHAPWQVNISGTTAQDIGSSIARLKECLERPDQQEQELQPAVEEMFRCFVATQKEVYENLRRDPYPRFSLTPIFAELNKNENLKRLLALEHIELQSSTHSPTEPSSSSPEGSHHGEDESSRRKATQDSSRSPRLTTTDDRSRGKPQRPSPVETSVPVAGTNWEKNLISLNVAARLDTSDE